MFSSSLVLFVSHFSSLTAFTKKVFNAILIITLVSACGCNDTATNEQLRAPDTASAIGIDTDGDSLPDHIDQDDDNDGTPDELDAFPLDNLEQLDHDQDGTGDVADLDDDNDGTPDDLDAFPLDSLEQLDHDQDGTGDNADLDDDNDGVKDSDDTWPLDSACSVQAETFKDNCIYSYSHSADFIEYDDSGHVYLINSKQKLIFKYNLEQQSWDGSAVLEGYANGKDRVKEIEFSRNHERLYVGYTSGVLMYIDPDSLTSVTFHQSQGPITNLTEAGNFISILEPTDSTDIVLFDSFATEVNRISELDYYYSTPGVDILWLSTANKLVYLDDQSAIRSLEINQTNGEARNRHHVDYTEKNSISAPLIASDDETKFVVGTGSTFFTDTLEPSKPFPFQLQDAKWLPNGDIIALHVEGQISRLVRYNGDGEIQETTAIKGKASRLFAHNEKYHVMSNSNNRHVYTVFQPSEDSDHDTVPNDLDAFPDDPAASVDTDRDGAPDRWNNGYTASDSTSGLTLDAFPDDWSCFRAADGNGEHCRYDSVLPATKPVSIFATANDIIHVVHLAEKIVSRWDHKRQTFLKPFRIERDNDDEPTSATAVAYSPSMERLYVGYQNGSVSYLSLQQPDPAVIDLLSMPGPIAYLSNAGNFIKVEHTDVFTEFSQYYNHQGAGIDKRVSKSDSAVTSTWDNLTNRLYYMDMLASEIRYDQLNDQGNVQRKVFSSASENGSATYSPQPPILLSQDRSKVFVGNSSVYDGTTLRYLTEFKNLLTGFWTNEGVFAVGISPFTGGRVEYYDENLQYQSAETLTGKPLRIFEQEGQLIAVTYVHAERVGFISLSGPELQ